jgi:xanthine dehydrogenase accessory factor
MLAVWRAAMEQFEQGEDFVLATLISVQGSSPRHVGTRFLVRRDGAIVGTIGGGLLEADVQKFAAQALERGTSHRVSFSFRGRDADSEEMICGGNAEVLVEFVEGKDQLRKEIFTRIVDLTLERRSGYFLSTVDMPANGNGTVEHLLMEDRGPRTGGFPGVELAIQAVPEPRLVKSAQLIDVPQLDHPVFLEWLHPTGSAYIFGAGHVGECVAHLAAYVGFKVVVLDDRSEFASVERIPDADEVVVLDFFEQAPADLALDEDSYVVIVTRGHRHDKTVLEQVLKTNTGYIGMIGSRRKTRVIFEALLKAGFSREQLRRVHAPIGLPIGGETPQEIAVSIVAEMIQVRNQKEDF